MKIYMRLIPLIGAAVVLLLIAVACSSEPAAQPGIDEATIRSAVQEAVKAAVPVQQPGVSAEEIQKLVKDAIPAQEPGVSAAEIQQLVEKAITASVPEGTDPEVIAKMVADAVKDASTPGVTRNEVASLVTKAVSDAVMEVTAGQADQLTAAEVQAIVENALMAQSTLDTSAEPVKIGTLLDFTGDLGVFGKPMRNGVDLAADLLNEAGGILNRPIRPVHKDSGTSSQVATDAARVLINIDGVGAIVGSLSSGVTQAVALSVTIPNEVVLMSPASTSPALTVIEDNDFLFRTTVSDAAQGVVLARLARELGYDSAAALYVNNAYGEGLAGVFETSFEEAGGTVTALVPQEPNQPSYLSELRSATKDAPDVLVAIGYPESAGVYLREALEGGFIDTFLFVDGTKNQELFDGLGIENFEGLMGTAPGTPESDASKIFRELYEARFGELPTNPFIGETFDAFVIMALAIEKAGSTDGIAIRDAIRDVANAPGAKVGPGDLASAIQLLRSGQDINYEGVAGSQNFDANGDVLNTIEIWKIEDGEITSTGRFETP